jgi:hypothetical protein
MNILNKSINFIFISTLIVSMGFIVGNVAGIICMLFHIPVVAPFLSFIMGYYVGSRDFFVDCVFSLWELELF